MKYNITLHPHNTDKTAEGILARLFRELIHKPLIKGKKITTIDNIPDRLQMINQLKTHYKRHKVKIPDVGTITGWLYDRALTHKRFFTLLTMLVRADKIDLWISIHHNTRMQNVLKCKPITVHQVTYIESDDNLIIKDRDNITYLLNKVASDLELNKHMNDITDMLNNYLKDDKEYTTSKAKSDYKSKLKRVLVTPKVSWESFITFIELLLFTHRYDIGCRVYYNKVDIKIESFIEVGKDATIT